MKGLSATLAIPFPDALVTNLAAGIEGRYHEDPRWIGLAGNEPMHVEYVEAGTHDVQFEGFYILIADEPVVGPFSTEAEAQECMSRRPRRASAASRPHQGRA